jgi:hypothetical protein
VPPSPQGSLGGALGVAQRAPTKLGDLLAAVARQAFISAMDLALIVSAVAVGVAALVVLVLLPNRGTGPTDLSLDPPINPGYRAGRAQSPLRALSDVGRPLSGRDQFKLSWLAWLSAHG